MKRLSAGVAFSAHLLLSCSDKDIATNPGQPAGKRVSSPITVSAPVQAVNNLAKKRQEERARADSLRDAVEGDTTRRFIAGPIRSLTSPAGYAGEPSWSPDGRHTAFTYSGGRYSEIQVMELQEER